MSSPTEKGRYTFADYLTWDENERIEIINGEAFLMAAPSRVHQKISFEIGRQLGNFLEGKHCEAYSAPFGVRLFEQDGHKPEDVAKVNVLEGCFIELAKVFSDWFFSFTHRAAFLRGPMRLFCPGLLCINHVFSHFL